MMPNKLCRIVANNTNISLRDITTDSDDNVFVCGWFCDGLKPGYIVKLDKDLDFIKHIVIGDDESYELYGITTDSNGNIFSCGEYPVGYNGHRFYIAKFDSNLRPVKQITINSDKKYNCLYGITVDSNGNIFVCGYTKDPKSYYTPYIAKLSNDLNLIKQITVNGEDHDYFQKITIDSDGNIFVCGTRYVAKFDNDLNLIKFITIDTDWRRRFYGITVDNNENVFVCGESHDGYRYNFYLAKMDKDLNLVKQASIVNGYNNIFLGIAVNDDNIFAVGRSYSDTNGNSCIMKFDDDLTLDKSVIIDNGKESGLRGITTTKNRILLCGWIDNKLADNMFIAKFNNNLDHPESYETGSYTFIFREPTWLVIIQDWSVTTTEDWVPVVQNWTPQEISVPISI